MRGGLFGILRAGGIEKYVSIRRCFFAKNRYSRLAARGTAALCRQLSPGAGAACWHGAERWLERGAAE